MEDAGILFQVKSKNIDEVFPDETAPEQVPDYIASAKAHALWQTLSDKEKEETVILAADTIVILEGQILGKPANKAEAVSFLKSLSGKQHEVVTGVVLLDNNKEHCFSVRTKVYFRKLSENQIRFYIDNYQPFDKAGAYAIQEWIGLIGVEKIEGDYYNVVGLPMSAVFEKLEEIYPGAFR